MGTYNNTTVQSFVTRHCVYYTYYTKSFWSCTIYSILFLCM